MWVMLLFCVGYLKPRSIELTFSTLPADLSTKLILPELKHNNKIYFSYLLNLIPGSRWLLFCEFVQHQAEPQCCIWHFYCNVTFLRNKLKVFQCVFYCIFWLSILKCALVNNVNKASSMVHMPDISQVCCKKILLIGF